MLICWDFALNMCEISGSYVDPLAMKTVAPMSTIWGHVGSSVTPSSVKIQPENRLSSRILPQEPQLQKFQRRLAEPPALGAAQDDDDVPELVNLQEAAEEKIEPEAKKEPEMEDKKDCHNSLL